MICNHDIYARSMIFVENNMMNTWICWRTSAEHVWFLMIYMLYDELFWWFLMTMIVYDDSCLELMITTCNFISMIIIMINAMLSIMLGMLTC